MAFDVYEPLPSFARYKKLFCNGRKSTPTRALQYELLEQTQFAGKVLDVGGGDKADYRALIRCEAYDSVNIDPAMQPTWIVKVGEKLPCPKDHYDFAVSYNTLEHIFDARFVIGEIFAALKSGGVFVASVPFLYPVHAHPDDFFRPTRSWWQAALSEAGFKMISITPLMWGPFSTGLLCSGAPGAKGPIRHVALLMDLLYAKLRFRGETHFNQNVGRELQDHALGYFIKAIK